MGERRTRVPCGPGPPQLLELLATFTSTMTRIRSSEGAKPGWAGDWLTTGPVTHPDAAVGKCPLWESGCLDLRPPSCCSPGAEADTWAWAPAEPQPASPSPGGTHLWTCCWARKILLYFGQLKDVASLFLQVRDKQHSLRPPPKDGGWERRKGSSLPSDT